MSVVIPLNRWVARAIVVEQLNEAQWHAVPHGWVMPEGSLESRASGVNDFRTVVADALITAELTGLPVLVQAYMDHLHPLYEVRP